MQRLDCHVKKYEWGKRGEESEVARLFSAGHANFQIGAETPYAELWMGTHPDGPATVRGTSECLSKVMARASERDLATYFLENKNRKTEIHLPFIMKIMSIKHTLSLQVHPTKEQAAVLHRQDPINYPDRNHKPELAYALTRFELLCGFRPAEQIVENMKAFPELRNVMGDKNAEKFICCYYTLKAAGGSESPSESIELKEHLRKCFTTMLKMQVERPGFLEEQIRSLYARINANVRGCLIEDTVAVMHDTYRRFPNDVGCFAPLYVNHMILQPGECCYYAAEELHAYLSGECVECVGCSNNTIRAALTPKFIDRENIVNVLNYRMTDPQYYIVEPRPLDNEPRIMEFAPFDCDDFILHEIRVQHSVLDEPAVSTNHGIEIPPLDCPSIIVVVEGEAYCQEICPANIDTVEKSHCLKRGDIFYIPPGEAISLDIGNACCEDFLAYRTFSYEAGPDHGSRIVIPNDAVAAITKEPTHIINGRPHVKSCHKGDKSDIHQFSTLDNALEISAIEQLKKKIASANGKFDKVQALFMVESEMDGFL